MSGKQKKVTLTILMILCTICASSKELISRRIMQDGKLLDASEILKSPNPIIVFTTDTTLKGEWKVERLLYEGDYELTFTEESSNGRCTINPDQISWVYSFRYNCDPRHVAYILRVSFTDQDGIEDSMELRIVILPSKPTINVTHYTYTYDWSDDSIFPNCNMGLNLYSENATEYILWETESYIFSFPDYYAGGGYSYDANLNEVTYVEFDPDWGEYLRVEAENKYGSVSGDHIYTTDYIDDPMILARIEEIKKGAAVEAITDEAVSFRLNQNQIAFTSPVDNARIYDISGTQVIESPASSVIDISHLFKGIYILSYTVNSTTKQIKFQKR